MGPDAATHAALALGEEVLDGGTLWLGVGVYVLESDGVGGGLLLRLDVGVDDCDGVVVGTLLVLAPVEREALGVDCGDVLSELEGVSEGLGGVYA